MPNHKSAAKRARQTQTRTTRNRLVKAGMRSSIKKAQAEGADEQALALAIKDVYGACQNKKATHRAAFLVQRSKTQAAAFFLLAARVRRETRRSAWRL